MKRTIFTVTAALLIAAPAMAQKVNIDYASDFDFEGVETFQYVETEESSIKDNPMMADRVVGMIKSELTEGGLREVVLCGDLLHEVVFQPLFQRTNSGGVPRKGFFRESIDLINPEFHTRAIMCIKSN